MRTALKKLRSLKIALIAAGLLGGVLIVQTPYAHAADAATPPAATTPDAPSASGADAADKGAKGFANAEDKVSDSVKGVVKHLGTTENVTLDDLNSARQAVAKIEALIDIEKRLNELEKLRSEREGKSITGAVPASALAPMPLQPQFQPPASLLPMPASAVQSPLNNLEISRITGSGARYMAVLKMPDGENKTVEAGDHLPDGSSVVAVSSSGVEVEHNGTKRVIHVKNVGAVFGSTR